MKGGHAGEPVGGGPGDVGSGAAPISEALLDKARADEAESDCAEREAKLAEREARLAEHRARIAELESQLDSAREALGASERRREIERLLRDADTVDLETAALLTEAAVSGMSEPDVALAVQELQRRKPFLFHAGDPAPPAHVGVAMSPAGAPGAGRAELGGLADEARMSGDRRALLRYLRQRRGAG